MSITFARLIFFFFIGVCFVGQPIVGADSPTAVCVDIPIDTEIDENALIEKLDAVLGKRTVLQKLSFESDVRIQHSELLYLTGLKEGQFFAAVDLKKAAIHLKKKNKFEAIQLCIKHLKNGVHVQFKLQGLWTFKALKLHGAMLGKDAYRQYYLMTCGDPFHEVRHRQSVDAIRLEFKQNGYFASSVKGRLEYNAYDKSVIVHLTLDKGERFSIGDVQLILKGVDMVDDEAVFLNEQLSERFLNKLRRTVYTKKHLTQEAKALKKFLFRQGFLQATIELQERVIHDKRLVDLVWYVTVQQKRAFLFEGNHFFTDNDLLAYITPFGRGVVLLPGALLADEIKRIYREHGFWHAQVESHEKGSCCFFYIDEGERVAVNAVEINGMQTFSPDEIIPIYFSTLLKDSFFDEETLKQSFKLLLSFYKDEGFQDVAVANKEFVSLGENAYKLVITVTEGERCYLSSVNIEHFPGLEKEWPFCAAHTEERIPFSPKKIEDQRRLLSDYFQKSGYTRISLKPEYTKGDSFVSVTWKIDVERARFGKTVILGDTTFPVNYILRELAYKEGELWDREKLKRSLCALRELDVFESVQLYPDTISGNDKTVFVKLQKDDPFEARVRAGFGLQQMDKVFSFAGLTYKFGGTFLVKNPFNRCDHFCIDFDAARATTSVLASYRVPWLCNMPVKTALQGYSTKHGQPGFLESKQQLYEVSQQGFLACLSRKFSQGTWSATLGAELMKMTLCDEQCDADCATNLTKALNVDHRMLNRKIPYFFIEPTVLLDHLDDKLQPTRGWLTLVSLKGMFPINADYANAYFVRLLLEQSFFVPVRPLVLALRLRFGHIFYHRFGTILPTERFYLGGANSVRSYEIDRCPPQGRFTDMSGTVVCVPQGGKTLANINAELRFPIYKGIGGIIFQDLGFLRGDCGNKELTTPLLAATGIGLRYATPVGPLRLDCGWQWHGPRNTYAWFLTLGQAF